MHHPPEVRFLVGSTPWPRRLAWVLSALALLQVGWFSLSNWTLSWQMGLVGVSFVITLVGAWQTMQSSTHGALRWDGQHWQWSGYAEGVCQLKRHLDFQKLMLVSLHRPADRPVWLWLQRSHDPYHWLALRRAVVHSTSSAQAHRSQRSVELRPAAIP